MTAQVAIDSMFAQFYADWKDGTPAIVGYVPETRWQGVRYAALPAGDQYWCRVSEQTVLETRAAIGNQFFESSGLVFVQIFAPMTDPKGFENARALAELAKNAFRKQNALVRFQNARNTPLPSEDGFYRYNVVTEYDYKESKAS
jgi:hypothetical protein